MLVKTYSAAVNGLQVTTVTVEVSLIKGVMYHLTGLGDVAVREGRDRIAAAMQYNGMKFPRADITVNMAPADLKKEGSGFDLPLAIAILAADGQIPADTLGEYMMIGELGLDGKLQPAKGVLPIAIKARAEHFKGLIVPKHNEREAAIVNNIDVYGMDSLADVIALLSRQREYQPCVVDTRDEFYKQQYDFDLDFSDVRGQETVKRALEVAAAGLRQEHDGQAPPVHPATSHVAREPRDHANPLGSRHAEARLRAHIPAAFPRAASHHFGSGPCGRGHEPNAGRDKPFT